MIEKTYQPGAVESRICETWDLSGEKAGRRAGALDVILKLPHPVHVAAV
jgi:hypothetical protein